jgi:hypothetical protein
MRKFRHIRINLFVAIKRQILFEQDNDSYLEYKIYRRNQTSAAKAESVMKKIIDAIESLAEQMRKYLKHVRSIIENEKLDMMNNFAKELARLTNAITMTMSKFVEEINE